ncbi:MAG TPA: immunoglobulin domain-containing protein [Verrucomicrobiae bacterium]|jgi:hypothetical protein|nr:immunoglobulin domain-containing protein [Verrucomicrobiae bacterium]
MNIHFIKRHLLFLMGIGIACGSASAAPVSIPDFSFENTTNITFAGDNTAAPDVGPSWHASGNGGVFIQDITNTFFAGDTLPAPADGTNYITANINGHTARLWQDIGALQPNTVYTLTVAVGNSAANLTGQGFIGLVNGTSPFSTLLANTAVDSGSVAPGAFSTFTFSYTNGYQASGDLTILMEGDTGAQILFDNVQLDATAAPASATALPILASPTNSVYRGTIATLSENPAGTPSFFYQWQTDNGNGGGTWSNVGGNSNNVVVDTSSFTPGLVVQYQVIVTNNFGASTSAPIALVANDSQPVVTSDTVPALGSDVVGSSVTFSAQFGGTLPISYQWFTMDINGDPVTEIPDATNSTLTINNLQLSNYAFYYLQASNALGITASTERLFVVSNAPLPDVNGTIISPANQSGLGGSTEYSPTWTLATNGDLLLGLTPTSSAGNFTQEGAGGISFMTDGQIGVLPPEGNAGVDLATGGPQGGTSVVYTLPASANGWDLTNITVYGGWSDQGRDQQRYQVFYSTKAHPTNFDSLIADVNFNPDGTISLAGAQSATRTIITSTNGATSTNAGVLARGVVAVQFNFATLNNGAENGYVGYAEFQAAGVPSQPLPVSGGITPASGYDVVGNSVSITATFSSTTPVTYQWLKDGVAIPNATNTTLTLTNLQLSDTAQSPGYVLQASNLVGTVQSPASSFVVNPVPAADGNNVIDALAAQTGNTATFSPTWSVTSGSLLSGARPTTGTYNTGFNRENSGGIPILTDGQFGHVGSGDNTTLATLGTSGGQVMIYTLPPSAGGYNISNIVTYGGWGDAGRDAQDYTVSYSTVTAPTTFILLDSVAQDPAVGGVPNESRVTLSPGSGAWLATNVYAIEFNFNVTDKNGYQGYSELQLFGAPASALSSQPPAVAKDILPVTGSDVVGSSVTFQAAFLGSGPLQYQWYVGGNPISGATGSALTLNNLQLSDSGNYNVVAYNSFGTNSSSTNTFTVIAAPAPVNGTVAAPAYQSAYAGLGFIPTWMLASGSLIAGQSPTAVGSGSFALEGSGGVNVLTAGSPGSYAAGNLTLASAGPGAGTSVTYSLGTSASGYNLNQVIVYGGWTDNGRDSLGFSVSYATVANPGTFVTLTSPQTTYSYSPPNAGAPTADRLTVSSATASPLAQNVASVKITFTAVPNNWSGYGQIQLLGTASAPANSIQFSRTILSGGNLIMTGSGGSPNTGYTLLSTTNVALPLAQWVTNTTGVFDGSGAFSNAPNVTSTNMFFRLRAP